MQIFLNNFNINPLTSTNFKAKKQIIKTSQTLTESQIKRNKRNQTILKMISEGFSNSEIAQKLKITTATVRNFLKSKMALVNSDGSKPLSTFQKNKQERDKLILEKLRNGFSVDEITAELGVSKSMVKKLSQKAKILVNAREERNSRILEKLRQGLSYEQISQEENLSRRYIESLKYDAVASGQLVDFRQARNLRIIEAYQAGVYIEKIAEQEKISEESVRRILIKSGLEYVSDPQKRRALLENKILDLLKQGVARKDIVRTLNVDIGRVNHIAEKHNVFQSLITERNERIIEKLKDGDSVQKIADDEGIAVCTVLRAIEAEGIKQPKLPKRNDKKRDSIIQDIKKGLRVCDIAKKYKVSSGYVTKIKSELGLTKKYNYSEQPNEFGFYEVKEQSQNITKLREAYRRFKLGNRNPEIFDEMLKTINTLKKKLKEFKSRLDNPTKP